MNDAPEPPPHQSPGPGLGPGGASEISRRVGSILDAVEQEAQRLQAEAREEAKRYLEYSRQLADGLVDERRRRIAEISDELIRKSEAVVGRLEDAAPVRQGFENLVRALGEAAERLSREIQTSGGAYEPPPYGGVAPPPAPPPPAQPPPMAPAEPPPAYHPPTPPPAAPWTYRPQQPPPAQDPYSPAEQQPPPPEPARADPHRGFPPQPHPARAPSSPGWQEPDPFAPAASPAPTTGPSFAAPTPPPAPGRDPRELDDARMVAIQMAATGATRARVREHLQGALGVIATEGLLDEIFGGGSGEDATVPWASGPR